MRTIYVQTAQSSNKSKNNIKMNKSESITNIAKALIAFDAEVSKIAKGEVNPFFKNKYAALPDILSAIKEPLIKAGLTVKQFPEGDHQLTTMIIHAESGEFLESTYTMKPAKDDPQGEGSRITYQRRYALGAALGLNIDEDDDADRTMEKPKGVTEKPLCNNEILKKAIAKAKAGEADVFENLQKYYRLLPEHIESFQYAMEH